MKKYVKADNLLVSIRQLLLNNFYMSAKMPPILALHTVMVMKTAAAFIVVGLGILALANVVGFTNDYYNGPTTPPDRD